MSDQPTLTLLPAGSSSTANNTDHMVQIETAAHPSWFLVHTKEDGSQEWYLRFQVTGLNPRIYGPFPSQHNAMLYLDVVLDEVLDALLNMFNDQKGAQTRYYSPAQDYASQTGG